MSSHHLSLDEDTPCLLTVFPELHTSYKWLICFASGSLCLLISFLCLFTPLTLSPLVTMCLFSVSMSLFWKKYFLFLERESSEGNRYYKKKDTKAFGSLSIYISYQFCFSGKSWIIQKHTMILENGIRDGDFGEGLRRSVWRMLFCLLDTWGCRCLRSSSALHLAGTLLNLCPASCPGTSTITTLPILLLFHRSI